jgi:hypothetical protein
MYVCKKSHQTCKYSQQPKNKQAFKAHPDRGGEPGAFVQLQKAYNILLGQAEAREGAEHVIIIDDEVCVCVVCVYVDSQ